MGKFNKSTNNLKSRLYGNSNFDTNYQNLVSQSKNDSIRDFFNDKPFFERTATLSVFLLVFSFICNTLSGFTESFWLLNKFDLFIPNAVISLLLSCVIVISIEAIKRYVLPSLFRSYFAFNRFDFTNLIIYLIATCISVYLSFESSKLLPSKFTEPTQINIDSVAASFDVLILAKGKEAKDYKASNNWKGTVVRKAVPTYNQFLKAKSILEIDKKAAIEQAKIDNDNTLRDWENKTTSDGLQLGYITIISEVLLFFIVGFLTYRKFRQYVFLTKNGERYNGERYDNEIPNGERYDNEIPNGERYDNEIPNGERYNGERSKQPNQDTISQQRTIIRGFVNGECSKNNQQKTSTKPNTKICLHCSNEFTYKHWNKKYCNDKCRIAAYEKRIGKKFHIKSKKISTN